MDARVTQNRSYALAVVALVAASLFVPGVVASADACVTLSTTLELAAIESVQGPFPNFLDHKDECGSPGTATINHLTSGTEACPMAPRTGQYCTSVVVPLNWDISCTVEPGTATPNGIVAGIDINGDGNLDRADGEQGFYDQGSPGTWATLIPVSLQGIAVPAATVYQVIAYPLVEPWDDTGNVHVSCIAVP